MSKLFKQLLLVFPFTTTVATLSILPDHHLPPSNYPTLFHLSYRILEETAAGTFVANLFKDMKMHESPYRLFHLDLSTQRIPLTRSNRFHILSVFQNQSLERSSGALGQFEYTLVNLPGFSSGNSNATEFFEVSCKYCICLDWTKRCLSNRFVMGFFNQESMSTVNSFALKVKTHVTSVLK